MPSFVLVSHFSNPITVSPPTTSEITASPFQPTVSWPHGDLILRSSDSIEFRVHTLLMRLGSPVFADMLGMPQPSGTEVATQTVDLAENAEMIDVLLRWIYPVEDKPRIASLDDVKRYIPMATKYDVRCALSYYYAAMESPHFIASNPCRAYAIAVQNNASSGIRAAARLIIKEDIHVLEATPRNEFEELSWANIKHLDNFRVECIQEGAKIIRSSPVLSTMFHRQYSPYEKAASLRPFSDTIYTRDFLKSCYPSDQPCYHLPELDPLRKQLSSKLDELLGSMLMIIPPSFT